LLYLLDSFTRPVSSRTGSPPQSHMVAASSETRMTLSVPMIYIAHNEGRVSYIVQIMCELSRWSHRPATLLNHDGRMARYLRAGQIGAPSSLNKPQYTPRSLTRVIVPCIADFWLLLTSERRRIRAHAVATYLAFTHFYGMGASPRPNFTHRKPVPECLPTEQRERYDVDLPVPLHPP